MSTRIIQGLRVNRALLALEARKQGPLALAAVVFAVLFVQFLRFATGSEAGEVGESLPFLPLGIAGLCAAFIAADAWSQGTLSSIDRALSAAPLRSHVHAVSRLVVSLLCAAAVAAAVTSLEPAGEGTFAIWSRERAATAVISTVVLSALAGLALRHGLGAALVGVVLGTLPIWLCAWYSTHAPTSDLDALVRIALVAYLDSTTLLITLVCGLCALLCATHMRGRSARSPLRRSLIAAGAAAVFVSPGIFGAAKLLHSLVWVPYDQFGARVFTTPSPDGARVLVHVALDERPLGARADERWTSAFIVDSSTGAVERLPCNREFHGNWIDARTLAYHDRWGGSGHGQGIHALDLDSGRTWLRDNDRSDGFAPWKRQRAVARNGSRQVFEYRLRTSTGSFSPAVRGISLRSHSGERFFLLDEEERIAEVFADGRPPSYELDVPRRGSRRGFSLSPDERWLMMVENREVVTGTTSRIEPMTLLFDLEARRLAAEIEGRGWSWRRGPAPLLIQRTTPWNPVTGTEGTSTWLLAGPEGVEALPFDCNHGPPIDLDGDRWLVESYAGGLAVHAADGALLRTLRRPSLEGSR